MRANNWVKLTGMVVLFSISAFADHGDNNKSNNNESNGSLTTSIIGSTPNITIGGIQSGGAPGL